MRVVKKGGTVSAILCFCHSGNLPTYHGRYLAEDNHRIDYLNLKLTRAFRVSIRSRILGFDHAVLSADVFPQFSQMGLVEIEINGHLGVVSPSDSRMDPSDAAEYSVARSQKELDTLTRLRDRHADELNADGFTHGEFVELLQLTKERHEYLRADPLRSRRMGEVFSQPLLIMRGTRPQEAE
jgi:hypothetical protein